MCRYGHEDHAECVAEGRKNELFKASSYSQEYDSPCDPHSVSKDAIEKAVSDFGDMFLHEVKRDGVWEGEQ